MLSLERLTLPEVRVILPPQLSPEFVSRLSERLGVPRERFVDIAERGADYFTSSLAYTIREARDKGRVRPGDVGLVINVGSGIQVGCAAYYI